MDPDEALKLFLDKCAEHRKTVGQVGTLAGDFEIADDAHEALKNLLEWVQRGGSLPTVRYHAAVGQYSIGNQ